MYGCFIQQDAETQKKGVVVLIYSVGVGHVAMKLDREVYTLSSSFIDCLPLRFNPMHYCFDNYNLRPVLSFVQFDFAHTMVRRQTLASHLLWTNNTSLLSRTHNTFFKLSRFSYRMSIFTCWIRHSKRNVASDSRFAKFDYQMFLKFIKQRRRLEAASSLATARNTGNIDFPLSNDVLLGRGRPYQEFTGNARLSAVIDMHRDAYDQGNRTVKTAFDERNCKNNQRRREREVGEAGSQYLMR